MILVFEQKVPQVHKLHDRMVMTLQSFLGCFMKREVIANISPKRLKDLYEKLKLAYMQAAKYIPKKFALDNPLLCSLSALEPVARGHSATHKCLLDLLKYFKFTLPEDPQYTREISEFQLDTNLPEFAKGIRLDEW